VLAHDSTLPVTVVKHARPDEPGVGEQQPADAIRPADATEDVVGLA
jgi:hypothetical protein